jgi:hypothetical protein
VIYAERTDERVTQLHSNVRPLENICQQNRDGSCLNASVGVGLTAHGAALQRALMPCTVYQREGRHTARIRSYTCLYKQMYRSFGVPRSVVFRRYGGPEVLEIVDEPHPKPTSGQVLVRIVATALNPGEAAACVAGAGSTAWAAVKPLICNLGRVSRPTVRSARLGVRTGKSID